MARSVLLRLEFSFLFMLCLSFSSAMVAEADELSAGGVSSQPICLNCSLCGSCQPKQSPPPPPPTYLQPPPPAQTDCPPTTIDTPPPPSYSQLPYYNYGASSPSLVPGMSVTFIAPWLCVVMPLVFGVLF